jgi:hypothetical protein
VQHDLHSEDGLAAILIQTMQVLQQLDARFLQLHKTQDHQNAFICSPALVLADVITLLCGQRPGCCRHVYTGATAAHRLQELLVPAALNDGMKGRWTDVYHCLGQMAAVWCSMLPVNGSNPQGIPVADMYWAAPPAAAQERHRNS